MAPNSNTAAQKIPWMEEPGGLQSMGLLRVRHDWVTSLSLSTFMHWRRKWQPTLVFLPGESHGQRSLVGYSPLGRKESDTTEWLHYTILYYTIPLFIAILFTIARTWKQPRCPLTDDWIKMLWYIYTMEYYSAIKRNVFESVLMRWMNLEPIMQSEVSQKEKDTYLILTHIYRIYKNGTEEHISRAAVEKQR